MFGYFEADRDFQSALDLMGNEAINKTWQDAMKHFVPDVDPENVEAAQVGQCEPLHGSNFSLFLFVL